MVGAQELGRDVEDLIKTPANDALHFGELEREILRLWDAEQEVNLELNLLRAQRNDTQYDDIAMLSDEELQEQLAQAERDLMTARSKYTIRQNIVSQVLTTDPILKSLHASPQTLTSLERRLPPLIQERDTLSMLHIHLSKQLQTTHAAIAKHEQENIEMMAKNKALASRMLDLAKDVKIEKVEEVRDARMRSQLEKLEGDVSNARKEWRIWKSVVGGIIAGSGVDWAADTKLLEVVMDEEDEIR